MLPIVVVLLALAPLTVPVQDPPDPPCCTSPLKGKVPDCLIEEAKKEVLADLNSDLYDPKKPGEGKSLDVDRVDLKKFHNSKQSTGGQVLYKYDNPDPDGPKYTQDPDEPGTTKVVALDVPAHRKSYAPWKNGKRGRLTNCDAIKDVLCGTLWHEWHHYECGVEGDVWVNYADGHPDGPSKYEPTCDHAALSYSTIKYLCRRAEALDPAVLADLKRIKAICTFIESERLKLNSPLYKKIRSTPCPEPPCGLDKAPPTTPNDLTLPGLCEVCT
jgi:hypothetical protein